jgi:hypothetical protein
VSAAKVILMAADPRREHELARAEAAALDPAPLSILWPLLGRHIAFHRRLVDLTSSVKAALLLSQSIYWTRHGRDIGRNGGWFFKTAEQWALETGLSAKEQASAREVLRNLTLLEDRRAGVPARLHYRVGLDALGARLSERIGSATPAGVWRDGLVLAELLGPSVAFHRALVDVAGSVHAGLMLSRALHLTRMQVRRRVDQWIVSSAARWFEELGLTRREQETARRDLVQAGLWEERLRGIPPSLVARIRVDWLLARLADDIAMSRRLACVGADPDREMSTCSDSPKGGSSLRQPRRLAATNPPPQFAPVREHSPPESADSLMRHSTGKTLQPSGTGATQPSRPAVGCADLIFPDGMLPEERRAAEVLLRSCGANAQALLDELDGRLRRGSVRASPLAYLRGLMARADAGSFVPELGPGVAAARVQREREAALRREREAEARRLAAERATPEYQTRARAQRERVRRLLDELKAPRDGGRQP